LPLLAREEWVRFIAPTTRGLTVMWPSRFCLIHLCDRAKLRERFEREARTVASLNHSHIRTLYDIGRQEGIEFLVMEYLEGEALAQRLLKGPLPLDQVMRYATEIADALDKAHRKGITHRDLKPGNIMLTKSGPKAAGLRFSKAEAGSCSSYSRFAASAAKERGDSRRNDPGYVAIHGTGASRSQRSGCL
jgi:serine/threonine protein kinase